MGFEGFRESGFERHALRAAEELLRRREAGEEREERAAHQPELAAGQRLRRVEVAGEEPLPGETRTVDAEGGGREVARQRRTDLRNVAVGEVDEDGAEVGAALLGVENENERAFPPRRGGAERLARLELPLEPLRPRRPEEGRRGRSDS